MESQDKVIESLTKTIEIMTNELSLLREQIEYLRQKLYGKSSEKVVYQPGQLSLFGEEFLGDYAGYVHCDMWSAYRQLDKAQLVGCWAHVRRKFFEATPKKTDRTSLGAKGLAYCDRLFALENDWADLSTEERRHIVI